MTEQTLLTATDIAALLGKSKTWVHDQARRGAIPHHRVGRTIRFTQDDIRDYLTATRRDATTENNPWGLAPRSASRRRRAS